MSRIGCLAQKTRMCRMYPINTYCLAYLLILNDDRCFCQNVKSLSSDQIRLVASVFLCFPKSLSTGPSLISAQLFISDSACCQFLCCAFTCQNKKLFQSIHIMDNCCQFISCMWFLRLGMVCLVFKGHMSESCCFANQRVDFVKPCEQSVCELPDSDMFGLACESY